MSLEWLKRARELAGWLRIICKNPKLRVKDIAEWWSDEQTVRKNARSDETVLFVPQLGLWVSVMTAAVKRPILGEGK
jgi:hypothetical protein